MKTLKLFAIIFVAVDAAVAPFIYAKMRLDDWQADKQLVLKSADLEINMDTTLDHAETMAQEAQEVIRFLDRKPFLPLTVQEQRIKTNCEGIIKLVCEYKAKLKADQEQQKREEAEREKEHQEQMAQWKAEEPARVEEMKRENQRLLDEMRQKEAEGLYPKGITEDTIRLLKLQEGK